MNTRQHVVVKQVGWAAIPIMILLFLVAILAGVGMIVGLVFRSIFGSNKVHPSAAQASQPQELVHTEGELKTIDPSRVEILN